MPGFASLDYVHATLLTGTSPIICADGVLNATGGTARDTEFFGWYINLNATAVTLTVTGLGNSANPPIAATWVINGQTTVDDDGWLPWPLLNEFGPFTFQASVSNLVWVYTRAYVGP